MGFDGLIAKDIVAGYGQVEAIIRGVSMRLMPGERVAIIGPNGSGKSTLVKVLAGIHRPVSGQVYLNGEDIFRMNGRVRAVNLTRVPQNIRVPPLFTVEQYVSFGRYPHLRLANNRDEQGKELVANAIRRTGLEDKATHPMSSLSGGEKQRAALAQALAQDVPCLLLDEPNASLDLRHQLTLIDILQERHSLSNGAILTVLHDINLAARFGDRIYLMSHGVIYAEGSPSQVLTEENLRNVYGVRAAKVYTPDGKVQFVFMQHGTETGHRLPFRLHIVGGGGSAGLIMPMLYQAGYEMSLGMVQRGDTDLLVADYLGIPAVSTPLMEKWGTEEFDEVRKHIEEADGIVVADTWFGSGNTDNLRLVIEGQKDGKPVWMLEESPFELKDYTGGVAKAIRDQMVTAGAVVLNQPHRLLESLQQRFGVQQK